MEILVAEESKDKVKRESDRVMGIMFPLIFIFYYLLTIKKY